MESDDDEDMIEAALRFLLLRTVTLSWSCSANDNGADVDGADVDGADVDSADVDGADVDGAVVGSRESEGSLEAIFP